MIRLSTTQLQAVVQHRSASAESAVAMAEECLRRREQERQWIATLESITDLCGKSLQAKDMTGWVRGVDVIKRLTQYLR